MTQPSFTRWDRFLGGYQYDTPAGSYTLSEAGAGVWVLATAGLEVGRFSDVESAETALDADVKDRMWS